MKIFVKAKPGAKYRRVEKIDETKFIVSVKEPAQDGRANKAIKKALADYFKVPVSAVLIVKGGFSHHKVIEIASFDPL